MSDHGNESATERPEDWPELFLDPSLDCNHAFHWDGFDAPYVCIYCGEEREEPK